MAVDRGVSEIGLVTGLVCRQCWTWYSTGETDCPRCGTHLTPGSAVTEQPTVAVPTSAQVGIPPGGARHRRHQLTISLAAVAAVAAGILLALAMSGSADCGIPGPCTRVLFIGNSYTSVNDLPSTFAKLARSGGHRVDTGAATADGASLADHLASSATAAALTSANWNIVVLQEQSQIPAVDQLREAEMYPAARALVAMVRHAGAQPVFFITWAHRDGWPQNGLVGYTSMQSAIDDGYLAIAQEQRAAVAPVGYAWETLLGEETSPGLWQDDGSHPTEKGTYLAACVFYATIFRESPKGLPYHGDVSGAEASKLQAVAASTVLGDPAKWGLP
jgi:uncharacterized protein DUF4886